MRVALPGPRVPRLVRSTVINIIVPVLLAWVCVSATRHFLVSDSSADLREKEPAYGPVRLRIKLPGTAGGIPEPLFVFGEPGKAALVYIRLLKHARAKVGVEFWGLGAYESETFDLPAADATIDVSCYLPVFFPEVGDSYWGSLSEPFQRLRRSTYLIAVNGVERLKGPVRYDQAAHAPFYIGSNPIGGSLVSDRFTGAVLSVAQPN